MRRYLAAIAAVILVSPAGATQFPVTPESGAWMILVQSYAGEQSAVLSEELAAALRRDYKLNAYVFNRGDDERTKEHERVAKLRQQQREQARASGIPDDAPLPKIKTVRIEDQYAVLIGGWKDIEAARKALADVRKLKPPAEKFLHQQVIVEPGAKPGTGEIKGAGINPFYTAFVVHNPTVPMPADPDKGKLDNLKECNAGESFSLLKCRKPFTLMVKVYQGAVTVAAAATAESKFVQALSGGQGQKYLNASGQQAHELAKALTQIKDARGKAVIDTDVYVLHTETASYVCVGGYDRADDPTLLHYQKKLANLQLGVVERLNQAPVPMPVPKP